MQFTAVSSDHQYIANDHDLQSEECHRNSLLHDMLSTDAVVAAVYTIPAAVRQHPSAALSSEDSMTGTDQGHK